MCVCARAQEIISVHHYDFEQPKILNIKKEGKEKSGSSTARPRTGKATKHPGSP